MKSADTTPCSGRLCELVQVEGAVVGDFAGDVHQARTVGEEYCLGLARELEQRFQPPSMGSSPLMGSHLHFFLAPVD